MNRHEFYDNLNKYQTLSHSGNYKYYNKIDLPDGKTRYFYTKAEWDAYQDGKGQEEYKIKKIMEKSKKPTQRESYTVKKDNTYGPGYNTTTYFARDNGTSRDAALVEKEKRDLYEYEQNKIKAEKKKEEEKKAAEEAKIKANEDLLRKAYKVYNDTLVKRHEGTLESWSDYQDMAIKFDKEYRKLNGDDGKDLMVRFNDMMADYVKSKEKEYDEAVEKAMPEIYEEYVKYKNAKDNGFVGDEGSYGHYIDIALKLDQISRDVYGGGQLNIQKTLDKAIQKYETMLKEGKNVYKARSGREEAIKKSQK